MIRASVAIERVTQLIRSDHMSEDQLLVMLQNRYENLYETFGWPQRKKELMLGVVAEVENTTSDTVTATLNSATITSAGTPFTSAMDGRQMVLSAEPVPFFITFSSTSVVTLQDGEGNAVLWPRATEAGQSWRIFQSVYSLPADCEQVLRLGIDTPLNEIDGGRDTLNEWDPERTSTASDPTDWCYAGMSTDTPPRRQVEIWPVPTEARIIRGEYLRAAPTLSASTYIDLPGVVVVYGLAADANNALFALTGDAPYQQGGIFYERKMEQAINDYRPLELSRSSLPRTFGKARRGRLTGDYIVNHQPPWERPW